MNEVILINYETISNVPAGDYTFVCTDGEMALLNFAKYIHNNNTLCSFLEFTDLSVEELFDKMITDFKNRNNLSDNNAVVNYINFIWYLFVIGDVVDCNLSKIAVVVKCDV